MILTAPLDLPLDEDKHFPDRNRGGILFRNPHVDLLAIAFLRRSRT